MRVTLGLPAGCRAIPAPGIAEHDEWVSELTSEDRADDRITRDLRRVARVIADTPQPRSWFAVIPPRGPLRLASVGSVFCAPDDGTELVELRRAAEAVQAPPGRVLMSQQIEDVALDWGEALLVYRLIGEASENGNASLFEWVAVIARHRAQGVRIELELSTNDASVFEDLPGFATALIRSVSLVGGGS